MNTQVSQNYASAAKTESFPSKDQAIILDAANGVKIEDYILEIAEKITAQQIRFASRISNNRVCVYVANKSIADTLIQQHKSVTIQNKVFPIRPLIARNQRVVLSNVPPIIPHSEIEKTINSLNIKVVSTITFLRAGLTNPQLSHIMSFRRQLYISHSDTEKLPEAIQITFDDTTYWIYCSADNPGCYHCKKEGHIAKNCPSLINNDTRTPTTQEPEETSATALESDHTLESNEQSVRETEPVTVNVANKRPASDPPSPTKQASTETPYDVASNTRSNEMFPPLPQKKKSKKDTESLNKPALNPLLILRSNSKQTPTNIH